MIKNLFALIAVASLLTSPTWACDSYEDCMNGIEARLGKDRTEKVMVPVNGKDSEYLALRAIAYKLDEISKKLDKLKNPCHGVGWNPDTKTYDEDHYNGNCKEVINTGG